MRNNVFPLVPKKFPHTIYFPKFLFHNLNNGCVPEYLIMVKNGNVLNVLRILFFIEVKCRSGYAK